MRYRVFGFAGREFERYFSKKDFEKYIQFQFLTLVFHQIPGDLRSNAYNFIWASNRSPLTARPDQVFEPRQKEKNMSILSGMTDKDIRQKFNSEHSKLERALDTLSGYKSFTALQWSTKVMRPALGVFAENGASDALGGAAREAAP
jgi:hypothetical protein